MVDKTKMAWKNEATGAIHLPKGRQVWPALLEPRHFDNDPTTELKFEDTILLPKGVDLTALTNEISAAALAKHGAEWKKKKLLFALKKTVDNAKLGEYAEEFPWLVTTKAFANSPPHVYGPDAQLFKGPASEVYGGRWVIAAVTVRGYDNKSKGVALDLRRIQLLDHAEPIGGSNVQTADGFEKFDVGADDLVGGTKAAATTDKVFEDSMPAGDDPFK